MNPSRAFFVENGFKVFAEILVPLVAFTKEQHDCIQDNPNEHINLCFDLVSDGESQLIANYALNLVSVLDKNVEKCGVLMLDFVLEYLQHNLGCTSSF